MPPWSKFLESLYKDARIKISRNGLIHIIHSDSQRCLQYLNEIMASSLMLGLKSTMIQEKDCTEATFYKSGSIGSYSTIQALDRQRLLEMELRPMTETEINLFQEVNEQKIREILNFARFLTKDKVRTIYAKALLESYSFMQLLEYNQSALSSWVIIEVDMEGKWNSLARDIAMGKNSYQLRPAENSSTTKSKIETLHDAQVISLTYYSELDHLRAVRNKAIHEREIIPKSEAQLFLKVALGITKTIIAQTKHASRMDWSAIEKCTVS